MRERDRDRDRDRDRETERDSETERDRETETDRQRQKDTGPFSQKSDFERNKCELTFRTTTGRRGITKKSAGLSRTHARLSRKDLKV